MTTLPNTPGTTLTHDESPLDTERRRLVETQEQLAKTARYHAGRAAICWDDDRRFDVEETAITLRRKPGLFRARLESSKHGCEWLIARWNDLGRVIDTGADWNAPQTDLAFRLLGVDPVVRLAAPWHHTASISAGDLVASEIERLERLLPPLTELDHLERDAAMNGVEIRRNPALDKLRREEAACRRRIQSLQHEARRPQPATVKSPAPTPATRPTTPPVTAPSATKPSRDTAFSKFDKSPFTHPFTPLPTHFDADELLTLMASGSKTGEANDLPHLSEHHAVSL